MGRPKGSKNAPKVTKAIIGEVINKPKISKTTGNTIDPIEIVKNLVASTKPKLEEEPIHDVERAYVEPAEPVKKKLPKPVRDLAEKVEFLEAEIKSLREYVRRIEDMMHVQRNEETNTPDIIPSKKHRKVLC